MPVSCEVATTVVVPVAGVVVAVTPVVGFLTVVVPVTWLVVVVVPVTLVEVATAPVVGADPLLAANFAAAVGVTETLVSAIFCGAINSAADFQSAEPFDIGTPSERFNQN